MSQHDPRLHPQSAALLVELGERPASPSVALARAGHEAMAAWATPPGPELALVEDIEFASGDSRVAVRRYVPASRPRRAIVYLHGGGWVIGSVASYDAYCRSLAERCDAQVFSVDYRLAPEFRYPIPLDDSQAALHGIVGQAARFGIDPARVLLAGDSAGGHLAIGVARRELAAGREPVAGLILIYPVTDVGLDSGSMREFETGFYLSRGLMAWFWQHFIGEDPAAHHGSNPELAPLRATDLGRLPPCFVLTAGCDVLRDEGEAFAHRVREQGGRAETLRMPGMLHGFIRFGTRIDAADDAIAALAQRVAAFTA